MLTNVPRIRDTETQVAVLEQLGVKADWSDDRLRLQADGVTETAPDEALSAKIRASFLLAGPLLARFGEARMPPPGGDFIGRRRLDPHLDAFKDLGARVEGDREIEIRAPAGRAEAVRDLHGRAVGDGDRERADGRRPDPGPDDDRQRRLRAARPGPRAAAGEDGRPDRRDRLQRDDRPRPRQARRRRAPRLRRPHRGRQLHGAGRGDRRRAADPRRRAARPDHDPPPVPPPRPADDDRGQRRARAAGAEARGPRRPRRRDPEDRRRPLAGVPGRPDLDRPGAGHPGAGYDPDLREDVREPPFLRRQARRHGRSDHALRSPQGDRQRSEPASR